MIDALDAARSDAVGRTLRTLIYRVVGSASLVFDKNGNMTTDEQGRTLIYDAWNRLVTVKNGSTTLAS